MKGKISVWIINSKEFLSAYALKPGVQQVVEAVINVRNVRKLKN